VERGRFDGVLDWLAAHGATTGMVVGASLVLAIASTALMVFLIARMSPDYFVAPAPPPGSWRYRHPVLRFATRVLKNLLGVVFVLLGLAMLVLPGQGALTILVGVCLLEFPGKRKLELRIMSKRPVHRAIKRSTGSASASASRRSCCPTGPTSAAGAGWPPPSLGRDGI
jgi:hypothetical protein